ncbi:unnamed protein product [Microthlaspi erraticum]|uniref:Uncharacterized protein n=1 Tax=Microthlaspi erraticum TaxID=1685480 RepID=A0A6D2KCF3_9BRAS|nr:unnamed protein product [Microthlaspi erraticum]
MPICCPDLTGEVAGVGRFDPAACLGKESGHENKSIMFDIHDKRFIVYLNIDIWYQLFLCTYDFNFILYTKINGVLLQCELSGSMAASFDVWNRVKGGVVVCVIWWDIVDYYKDRFPVAFYQTEHLMGDQVLPIPIPDSASAQRPFHNLCGAIDPPSTSPFRSYKRERDSQLVEHRLDSSLVESSLVLPSSSTDLKERALKPASRSHLPITIQQI